MSTPNLNSLFEAGVAAGQVSAAAANVVLEIANAGANIQNALGVSVDDVDASEVTIITLLVDDSGSIEARGNEDAVREGHNLVLDTLNEVKASQKDGILIHCRLLNGKILYPYVPIDQAIRMTKQNYTADGGTPLYDQTAVVLGGVLTKTLEFADAGVPCRSVTAIVTDGKDEHSRTHRAGRAVAPLINDLLARETHIISGMGIYDGRTDFREIFREMGIREKWILTPGDSRSELRKCWGFLSQSALRASQAAGGNFSKVAAGGFGAP